MVDREVDLRRLFGLIRRRSRLIVSVTAICVIVSGLVSIAIPPVYSSTATVIFDPQRKDLLNSEMPLNAGMADNTRVESEVELLRSDSLLLQVLATQQASSPADAPSQPGLKAQFPGWFGLKKLASEAARDQVNQQLNTLRHAINVQRRGPTYIIAIEARAEAPEIAADIANALAKAYLDEQVSAKVEVALGARDLIQSQLVEARTAIVVADSDYVAFLHQGVDRLASGQDGVLLRHLVDELYSTTIEQTQASKQLASIDASHAPDTALELGSTTLVGEQRLALASQIAFVDTSTPMVAALQERIAQSDSDGLPDLYVDAAAMQEQIAALQLRQSNLRAELRSQVMQSDLPADMLTDLFELQSSAAFARKQYETLVTRALELHSQAGLQVPDSRLVAAALPASSQSFPNTNLFMACALFGGCILGVGVSLAYESAVGGFMTEEQLEGALNTRVAATIPRLKRGMDDDTLADMVITAPLSQLAEAMRRTRLAIDASLSGQNRAAGQIVMITSAVPNEGKSSVALALARSYALSGRKTLLIDGDLRQPVLANRVDIETPSGLLEYLEAPEARRDCSKLIRSESDTGLFLLLGTKATDRPTDRLLTAPAFAQLLRNATHTHAIVIIDTPPVGPVVDALYMAPHADLIVMVTRWGSTAQRDSKTSLASLRDAKNADAPIISVLNDKDRQTQPQGQHYRRYYETDLA